MLLELTCSTTSQLSHSDCPMRFYAAWRRPVTTRPGRFSSLAGPRPKKRSIHFGPKIRAHVCLMDTIRLDFFGRAQASRSFSLVEK
jgi:hypothetical protein